MASPLTGCFSGNESKCSRQEVEGADEEVKQSEQNRNPDQSVEPRSDAGLDPVVGRRKGQVRWGGGQRKPFADLPHPASEILLPLPLFQEDEVRRRLDVADVRVGAETGNDVIAVAAEVNLVRRVKVDLTEPAVGADGGTADVVVVCVSRSGGAASVTDVDVGVRTDPDKEPSKV